MIFVKSGYGETRNGFTLLEMIIVVGITALLMGYILTYTSTSRNQIALHTEEARIAQTVARAKALSVATYNRPDVPCGYGVRFLYGETETDADSYSIFRYNPPECNYPIEAIDFGFADILNDGNYIIPEYLDIDGAEADALQYILFVPPNPDTYVWRVADFAPSADATVYLRTEDGYASLRVKVNSAGQISL